ncbi:12082_t:CDS:1, partial [Dentiscutata heterogama]
MSSEESTTSLYEILNENERDLVIAAEIGKSLLENNITLKAKCEELLNQKTIFDEREAQINYLELRIHELFLLIKNQKQKLINAFISILPEKELIQDLVSIYLELIKLRGKKVLYIEQNRRYKAVRQQLESNLKNDEIMEEIELILIDCEKLISWELELEDKFKNKTLLIECQKHTLKQVTDGSENQEEIVKRHDQINYQQFEQKRKISYHSLEIELAKVQGKLEVYEKPCVSFSESQNKTLICKFINILKEKPELAQKGIDYVNHYIKTKENFLAARQTTIEELKKCINKLEKKVKKQEIIGEISCVVRNVGGSITSIIALGIPRAVGEAIKASSNFTKIKLSSKSSEQFQISLSSEE